MGRVTQRTSTLTEKRRLVASEAGVKAEAQLSLTVRVLVSQWIPAKPALRPLPISKPTRSMRVNNNFLADDDFIDSTVWKLTVTFTGWGDMLRGSTLFTALRSIQVFR